MVYYRKYRPQTIGQLDSSKLRETLKSVLASPSVPHAFLFTGPKGLGKTSTARIVAKVLNCEHTVQHPEQREGSPRTVPNKKDSSALPQNDRLIEPDNTCEQCISITNGTNIDVLEIDGASNRGIDEIRELRERVKLAPSLAKKKVYIIDEVHMLTTEAFNALLKTIEEPPSHAVFIFCTTEAHKVPATILSRCFHVAFNLATQEELVHALERIVQGEKLQVEKEALELIAQMAEGGFRDATKILEEMVAVSDGKPITKALVEEKLHVSGISYLVSSMLVALFNKNTKQALELIEKVKTEGIDIKYFLVTLLEALHALLLAKVGIKENAKYPMPNIQYQIADIQSLVLLFSDAYTQTKTAVIPALPLEMAIIMWGENAEDQKSNLKSQTSSYQGPTIDTLKKQQQTMKVRSILYPQEKGTETKKQTPQVNAEQSDLASVPTDGKLALLENLLYKVKPINASVAGLLRGSRVKEVSDSEIILEASYKFHKEKLEEPKTSEIIEKAIKEITGKPLKVRVLLKQ